MEDVLTLVLGGGRGARLYPLTKQRSEPAVPIAGKYRLIDIPLSNCINSGFMRVYVLTQYLSVSLHKHIGHTYEFDPFSKGFVEVLAAQQTNESANWYQGTADAIRQNIHYLEMDSAQDILILSGDQLYRMDYRELLKTHRDNQADVTIAVAPVTRAHASRLGIVGLDNKNRIINLVEKPQTDEQLNQLRTPAEWFRQNGLAGTDREYLANMGIYLFSRKVLLELLQNQPLAADLVTEVFARRLSRAPIQGHLCPGYWADVGTIKAYHEANLALASDNPPFDFNSSSGVIFTRMRNLPAARVDEVRSENCLISDGCIVEKDTILERCVVGVRSRIGRKVTLRETVMIGADRNETTREIEANRKQGIPNLGVADNTIIERAILDKDCRIGKNVQIVNRGKVQQADGEHYYIRDGIVVIPNGAVIPDGTVI